jgi:hypothetical protein
MASNNSGSLRVAGIIFAVLMVLGFTRHVPPSDLPDFVSADTGGDAAETTLNAATFVLMNMSLTETKDRNSTFTVNANEICYTGVPTITAHILIALSFDRTTGAGTDTITMQIGVDTTGAIGDGDEVGDPYARGIVTNSIHEIGAVGFATDLNTNDCVGLLAKTDDVTGGAGWTMHGANFSIMEW